MSLVQVRVGVAGLCARGPGTQGWDSFVALCDADMDVAFGVALWRLLARGTKPVYSPSQLRIQPILEARLSGPEEGCFSGVSEKQFLPRAARRALCGNFENHQF